MKVQLNPSGDPSVGQPPHITSAWPPQAQARSQSRLCCASLDLIPLAPPEVPSPSPEPSAPPFTIRYAAFAHSLIATNQDPQTELQHLREFCADVTNLRRSDLSAGRLALEQHRLSLLQVRSDAEKEKECWEWAKRPDIQEKLFPKRDPDQVRRDVERLINLKLLGIRDPDQADECDDPACLI